MDRIISALREALTAANDEIAAVQKQQNELVDRLDRLLDEKKGLEFALARHEGREAVAPNGWLTLTRTGAIERVLHLEGNPLSPAEITSRLQSTGRRGDRYELVSAGLSYLKRIGVARSAGYGLWELSPDHRSGDVAEPEDEEEASDSE